jgi:hypothetical protein
VSHLRSLAKPPSAGRAFCADPGPVPRAVAVCRPVSQGLSKKSL